MPRFPDLLRRRARVTKDTAVRSEVKAVLADYYANLWQYEAHRRARYWPVERAVVEGFERVVWVFKSVNAIGSDHSRLPFTLTENDQEVDDHPLLDLLNEGKANPLETGTVFRKRLSGQILLSKAGAFVEKTMSNGGTIKRLDLLPPDRTILVPGSGADLVDHVELTRRDGSRRSIDWDKVLWFRDPHLLDPYSGITPLEAAGMSVELDYFARLYNVSFMKNDGRPGGVLGVRNPDGTTTDMDLSLMDRIEARFGKGPVEAGKLSVISGELSYIDMAAKPRDMQYGATSKNSKIEILASFGVSETVLGYSADRTFANAEQETYNYWTITQPNHSKIIVDGFNECSEDGLKGGLDTSKIEVLQRAAIARREEARKEVDAGLRSIKSYADMAGYGDEIEDTVHTRSLYIGQGKTPIPSKAADAKALGLDQPTTPPPALPGATPPALPAGPGAAPGGMDVTAPAAAAPGAPNPTQQAVPPAGGGTGTAAAALAAATAAPAPAAAGVKQSVKRAPTRTTPTGRVLLRIDRETPALPPATDVVAESAVDESARDRLEVTLTAALSALSNRWIERTVARLESPKSRKGTRHWTPDGPHDTRGGTKALDSAKAVDEETWSDEAETGTEPIITAAAVAAAAALLADFGVDENEDGITRIVSGVVSEVIRMIRRTVAGQAENLVSIINAADQNGIELPGIVVQVREFGAKFTTWAEAVGTQAATATVNGATDAAAADVEASTSSDVTRTWLSRRDTKVRHSHHKADGQQQPVGQPFVVGRALLRYPGDPLGPPEEVFNCRCRLLHRSKRSGRWVTPPAVAS